MPLLLRIALIIVFIFVVFPTFAVWGFCSNIWHGEFREIGRTQVVNWFGMTDAVRAAWRGSL